MLCQLPQRRHRCLHRDIPISDIEIGDTVYAYDELTRAVGEYEVIATINHVDEDIIPLYLDGERIETTSGTSGTSFGDTGEQTDANGDVFLRARYYDPGLGVFTAKDPVWGSIGSSPSYNGYGYVHGNPTNLTDPTGMCIFGFDTVVCAYAAAALVVAAGTAITGYIISQNNSNIGDIAPPNVSIPSGQTFANVVEEAFVTATAACLVGASNLLGRRNPQPFNDPEIIGQTDAL